MNTIHLDRNNALIDSYGKIKNIPQNTTVTKFNEHYKHNVK